MFEPDLLSGRVPIRPRRTIEQLSDTVIERLGEATPQKAGLLSAEDKEKLSFLNTRFHEGNFNLYIDKYGNLTSNFYPPEDYKCGVQRWCLSKDESIILTDPYNISISQILALGGDTYGKDIAAPLFLILENWLGQEIFITNGNFQQPGPNKVPIPKDCMLGMVVYRVQNYGAVMIPLATYPMS